MRNATDTTSGRPPGSGSLRLSKSRFTTGLQCYRQLWWQAHEPDAPELVADAAQRAIFDQGAEVGRVARERVPGGVLIDFPYRALAERVEATRIALESGAPAIYEASFIADDTFAAVDILERVPGGWALIEVKSTTKPKREHLPDIAVQLHVVLQSGLTVVRAELMHLNRACAYPDLADLDGSGNMKFTTDYRGLYSTLLERWLGLSAAEADANLGGAFYPRLGFV